MIRLQYPNRQRVKRRLLRRQAQYQAEKITEETYLAVLNSYFAHLDHFDVQPFQQALVSSLR